MERINLDRRTLLKAAGATAAGAALAPRAGAYAQDTAPSGNLEIGKAQEAQGFDPALVTAVSSFQLMAPVYDQLVRFDADNQPQPMLAESWENLDDTTFVFTLRQGVTFHDGKPLTSADVKFSFDRIMDPATNSVWVSQFEPISAIETPDERTVRVLLKQPYGPILATLSADYCAIVPEGATDLANTMVGTGPFKLTEFTRDTQSVLSAHEGYWEEGLPKLAQLTYRIIPDEAARLAAIRTGELGLTSLADAASVELAQQDGSIQVITQDSTDYYLLGINTKVPPFDNVKVRQALSLAVDRSAILDAVFFGQGIVSGPIVPTLGDWATPIDQLPFYAPDPEQAKQLLAEADLADGFEMSILASPFYPEFVNIALVLQEQLKAIGVTVTLDQVEWGAFIDRWKARDFQTFVSYNGSGNDPDRALYPAFHTDGSVNAFQFGDPAIDALLEKGRATVDAAERHDIYHEVEQLIADAAPCLFLSTRTAYYALRQDVQGFEPNPIDTWDTLKQTTVGES